MAGPVSEARVAVRLGPLALDLATGTGWAVAFGASTIVYYLLRGLFSFTEDAAGFLFGWIPGVGKLVNTALEKAEQRLTHWVGQVAAASEVRMADAFHAAGVLVRNIGHEIYGLAVAEWQIASWVGSLVRSIASGEAWQEIFRNRQDTLAQEQAAQALLIQRAQKAIAHADQSPIAAGIAARTKPISARQAQDEAHARARDAAVTLATAVAIPGQLADLRERNDALERAYEAIRSRVAGLEKATTGVLATALAVTALARIGLDWLRCSAVSKTGKRLCRIDGGLLDSLLLGTTAIFGALSIVTLAHACLAAEEEILPLVTKGFRELQRFEA